jgi:hypothetical protein
MKISKSKFVAGVQVPKRRYLLVHGPELATEPAAQSSYSAERETMSWAYLYVTPLDPTRLTPKEIGKRAQP